MRIVQYVRADGENWIMAKIRHSPHCKSADLDAMLLANGWIRWDKMRERFNELKRRIARDNPLKFPNWKEVQIPMLKAGYKDLPAGIHLEMQKTEAANETERPIENSVSREKTEPEISRSSEQQAGATVPTSERRSSSTQLFTPTSSK